MAKVERVTVELGPETLAVLRHVAGHIHSEYPGVVELRNEEASAVWSVLQQICAPARFRRLGLTAPQYRALTFIDRFIREYGYSPSFEEIAKALGTNSRGYAHGLVMALAERHWISHAPGRQRSICVLALPKGEDHVPA